jgi:O-antigen/teichoic acid export membrane protein
LKSAARATILLGLSATVPPLTGLLTVKAWAHFLGPAGYGKYGLLFAATVLLSIIADFGMANTVVREGARRIADGLPPQPIWRAAVTIVGPAIILIVAACVVFRGFFETIMFGGALDTLDFWSCMIAFPLWTFAGIHLGILTAHHQVKAVALQNATTAILSSAASITCIYFLRQHAAGPALLANAAIRWGVCTLALYKTTGVGLIWPFSRSHVSEAKRLTGIGTPLMISMLIGPGASSMVPALVLGALGDHGVGYFQSSNVLTMSLFGILTAGLSQDFFPKISKVAPGSLSFTALISEQNTFVLFATGAAAFATMAFGPLIVSLLFTRSFGPLLYILPWQLLGLVFQMAAAPVSFTVLAHLRGLSFFVPALVSGVTILPLVYFLGHQFQEVGVGLAFAISSACNWLTNQCLARLKLGYRESTSNLGLLAAIATTFAVLSAIPLLKLPQLALVAQGLLGIGALVLLYCLYRFSRESGPTNA